MAKRTSAAASDGAAAFRKRQKITHDVPSGEDVESSDQLRRLLAFDQDLQRARHGLQSFKRLLDDVVASNDAASDPQAKLDILRQFLDLAKPRHIDDDAVFLADIMEMWSFAAQVNNEGVMSSVAVVLALLLQIISNTLDLVPHGLGICQTLLQDRQLKSLSKNLAVERSKGFIISPTLRMLREAVCLDGGAYAKRVVRARQSTFTSLGRNMEIGHAAEEQEDVRKTSIRTNAVRFFLSCLKYLHSDGRRELLSQRDLVSHLTFMIKSDPPYLVLEILDVLKTRVLMDEKIPRDVKFKCFNTKSLMRFLALYSYSSPLAPSSEGQPEVSDAAHQFLLYICSTPGAGILYPCTGLYPKESDDSPAAQGSTTADLRGISGDVWGTKYSDSIPVYNFVLSEFARKLRPWSNLKQSELLVSIFRAAPELIADYFLNNRSFTFEPKLSMTWIGYAAFLFDTMTLPLPSSFGDRARFAKGPPPTSILLDNILPLPINQKVLVRCLSPKSHLTSFFATRILLTALEKLAAAVKMQEEASKIRNQKQWLDSSRKLVDAFCQRIPDMKEIVRCYKAVPAQNSLHRTLASRLLRAYYQVIPRVALAANFDVATFFVDLLKQLNGEGDTPQDQSLGAMELENLVSIASYSPGMRWFSRIDNLSEGRSCSPFAALLRLYCGTQGTTSFHQLQSVLTDVAVENQVVASASGLRPLYQSLRCMISTAPSGEVNNILEFLDNCISRCATSPIKYLELLTAAAEERGQNLASGPCSLLSMTIVEQLPYATASKDGKNVGSLVSFLSLYFSALTLQREDERLVRILYDKAAEHLSSSKQAMAKLGHKRTVEQLRSFKVNADEAPISNSSQTPEQIIITDSKLADVLHVPFEQEADDTAVLVRWSTKSVEDLIEDAWAARLVRLLSSPHTNIRKEALTNILKMAAKIKDSSYEEKDQVWLLLSELSESCRPAVDAGPAPSALAAFAVHALDVIRSPLHPLYPKINAFLTRAPVWPADKLPLAHDILHGEPSEDDRYYTELAWLLTYLIDALRTPSDLDLLHRKRWFEKILALGSNPYLRSNLRNRILKVLYRATCIDGGSTTLITRFGLMSWLDTQRAACADVGEESAVYAALMRRAWETCDQKRVTAWSKDGIQQLLSNLA